MRSRNHFRVLQRKRYEARRFHNPYFKHEKKRNWTAIAIAVGATLLVAWFVGWIFGSSRFAIANVSIGGNETISTDQISARVWEELNRRQLLVFRASNRFLFDETRLREALSSTYAFETLGIDWTCELFGGGGCTMSVVVKEKTSQMLWQSGEHVYLADLQGVIIRELTPAELDAWRAPPAAPSEPLPDGTVPPTPPPDPLKRLPLFVDVNATPIAVGATVLTPEEVANLFLFHQRLTEMGIPFVTTDIDRLAGKWMAVQTAAGYDILIDASGDVDTQVGNLQILLRDTVTDPSGLEYIDLRFGDHVYYK